MELEDSNGKITKNVSLPDILTCLDNVGKTLDHCILSNGDDFIQAAASGSGLYVEFQENGIQYKSDTILTGEQGKALFGKYFELNPDWKSQVVFTLAETGPSEATADTASVGTTAPTSSGMSIKDNILNTVKNEASNSLGYMLRRAIRNLFRKIF